MSNRKEKFANLVRELSAEALARLDNHTSLITITNVSISPDLKNATIFISVMPREKEMPALHFIERNLGEIREHIKKNMETKIIPYLKVAIDLGEKNRQRIDELLQEK